MNRDLAALMGASSPWVNYILSQAVAASLGRIPSATLAASVVVNDLNVELEFQLSRYDELQAEQIRDVWGELEVLLGPPIEVNCSFVIGNQPDLTNAGPTRRYFYLEPSE